MRAVTTLLRVLLLLLPLGLLAQEGSAPRPWSHELTLYTGFGRASIGQLPPWRCIQAPCGELPSAAEGQTSLGLAYHYLRPVGRFWIGGGGSIETMGTGNREAHAALTILGEYRLGNRRLQPLGRMTLGLGMPIGSERLRVRDRSLGTVIHPAIGVRLRVGKQTQRALVGTLGYRFSSAHYSTINAWFQPVDRRLSYRRLNLNLGLHF